jgi:hypothetical protein
VPGAQQQYLLLRCLRGDSSRKHRSVRRPLIERGRKHENLVIDLRCSVHRIGILRYWTKSVHFLGGMRSASHPEPIVAGVSSRLFVATTVSAVAVAAGMHYNANFRNRVDQTIPGASDVLSKITNVDYSAPVDDGTALREIRSKKSNLPKEYEELPKLLHRIGEETEGTKSKDQPQGRSISTSIDSPQQHASPPAQSGVASKDSSRKFVRSFTTTNVSDRDAADLDADLNHKFARVFGKGATGVDNQLIVDIFDVSAYQRPGRCPVENSAQMGFNK